MCVARSIACAHISDPDPSHTWGESRHCGVVNEANPFPERSVVVLNGKCGDTQRRTPGTAGGACANWRLRGVCSCLLSHTAPHRRRPAVAVPPSLSLPVIEAAFPRQLHPYWPRLQENTRTWLLEKRLMPADKVEEYADGLCYTDLMAGYYLGAPDNGPPGDSGLQRVVLRLGRPPRPGHRARPACRLAAAQGSAPRGAGRPRDSSAPPRTRWSRGSRTACCGCTRSCGRTWNARFAWHFHEVIEAYDREFRNRTNGIVPKVEEYLELRRLTFAHWIWTDLLEPSAGTELPTAVRKNPAFRRAALLSQEFAAWYNDLCSLPKEIAGDEVHNLGISLIRHERLTLEEAIAEVRRRVEECRSRIPRGGTGSAAGSPNHSTTAARGDRKLSSRREGLPRQYAELVQFRLLVPPRVGPLHGRQLGRPLHTPVRQQRSGR